MNVVHPIAMLGELIGDPARAAILSALLDGRARTAGELAFTANISAQSASGHLSKTLDGGLLTAQSAGRHRYYSLAGAAVANALGALGAIATKPRARRAIHNQTSWDLRLARTCYDHLAGTIAVELAANLQKSKVIHPEGARDFQLGPRGSRWFAEFGIDVEKLQRSRRSFARQCIDWTERRPHLAGSLGAALCARLLALGWVARRRDTRALRITHRGAQELRSRFGVATSGQDPEVGLMA